MKTNKILSATLLMSTALAGVAQAQTIDYGMMESLFSEPVTASATGKPQRASDAPVSMEILGSEEIRRSGAKDIPQLLQRIAGVQVQRSYIGRADVAIRGYNKPFANRLLVLVNGRQILSDAFGQVNWETLGISMNEIRQIEVVKGPNSSLFGFNAESGVINIITASPLKDEVDVASVKLGTQEHKQVDFVHTAQFDNFGIRVSAGELISNGFNRDSITDGSGSTLEDEEDEWSNRRVAVDHEWQIDDSSNLRLQGTFAKSKTTGLIPYLQTAKQKQDQTALHATYTTQTELGLVGVNAYRMSDDWKGESAGYMNDLNVVQASNLFKVGTDHSIRIAGEYRHNVLTGKIVGDGNSKFDFDLWAPSVMWDWKVSDKWNWTNSVRYDHVQYGRDELPAFGPYTTDVDVFDRSIEEISFNSGLAYKPTTTDTFRASVSRGLHIPSLIELGSSQQVLSGPPSIGFHGEPGLEPERILALELAYDKKLTEHNANFRSAVFLQKVENVLGDTINPVFPGPSAINLSFDNLGDSTTWGVELGLDGIHNNWLRWGANYTYLNTSDDKDNLYYEDAQPEHQVSLMAGFDHGNWEFDTDLHFVSDHTQTFQGDFANPADTLESEDIDAYFVLNARAGYNVSDQLNVAIEGYNLVDNHREWAYANDSQPSPVGANTLGRSVLATLTYKY